MPDNQSVARRTTAATSNGYQTNQHVSIKDSDVKSKIASQSEVKINRQSKLAKPESQAKPDEFRIYDDKAIHGWLDKKAKDGYFASGWKRVFVTSEN